MFHCIRLLRRKTKTRQSERHNNEKPGSPACRLFSMSITTGAMAIASICGWLINFADYDSFNDKRKLREQEVTTRKRRMPNHSPGRRAICGWRLTSPDLHRANKRKLTFAVILERRLFRPREAWLRNNRLRGSFPVTCVRYPRRSPKG